MTKLERRIAEVAETVGKAVVVGRQGHKDEWFAHCDGIEVAGGSALSALAGVIAGLQQRADQEASKARDAATAAERLRSL